MPITQQIIRDKVLQILPRFGDFVRDADLSRIVPGPYDPQSQTATSTVLHYPCRVVLSSIAISTGRYSTNLIVEPTDQLAYAFDLTVDPQATDRLGVDGKVYEIVLQNDISAGSAIVWELVIR